LFVFIEKFFLDGNRGRRAGAHYLDIGGKIEQPLRGLADKSVITHEIEADPIHRKTLIFAALPSIVAENMRGFAFETEPYSFFSATPG
jgi:hypothetical protein